MKFGFRVPFWRVIVIGAAMGAANFSYQYLFADQPNWPIAVDRTYFQFNALVLAWVLWSE